MTYAIAFDFPEARVYAGRTDDGACGFAPTLRTADLFDDPEAALRLLSNGYSSSLNEWGRVVRIGTDR